MLIPLTNAFNKQTFGLSHQVIWAVERSPDNVLITKAITSMNSPKGLLSFDVMESPEEIIEMIAKAEGREVPAMSKPSTIAANS